MKSAFRFAAFALALTMVAAVRAAPIEFSTTLTGPQESPPNASPGVGTARVIIDPSAHLLRVILSFSGLTAPTTASHIHVINGPADTNTADTVGPVVTTVPSFVGFPLGVTAGAFDMTYDTLAAGTYNPAWLTANGGNLALAESTLFSGLFDGRAYLNVHTSAFPGGEIRGFLAVPEPGTLALFAVALVALPLLRRRPA